SLNKGGGCKTSEYSVSLPRPIAQLDCRHSPAWAWKPEANQCGFASAWPMIAEAGYVCMGICHRRSFSAHSHAPRASCGAWLAAKKSLGQVASFAGVSYTWLNAYVAHGSRSAPPLIMPHIPPGSPVGVSQQKTSHKIKDMFGGTPPNISHQPTHKHPHSEIAL
ncbi:hypothetical protein O181_117864, partial [Austropuccinia psidii MF-1]|nr:hypothetical protein [Austropuccinia psidii MF-1]